MFVQLECVFNWSFNSETESYMKIWTVKKSEEKEREHKRDLFELIALIVLSQNKTKQNEKISRKFFFFHP